MISPFLDLKAYGVMRLFDTRKLALRTSLKLFSTSKLTLRTSFLSQNPPHTGSRTNASHLPPTPPPQHRTAPVLGQRERERKREREPEKESLLAESTKLTAVFNANAEVEEGQQEVKDECRSAWEGPRNSGSGSPAFWTLEVETLTRKVLWIRVHRSRQAAHRDCGSCSNGLGLRT